VTSTPPRAARTVPNQSIFWLRIAGIAGPGVVVVVVVTVEGVQTPAAQLISRLPVRKDRLPRPTWR
jgi:hypothetical protein